ncbi:ABC transporter ATP-binding protein [Acidobacteria bacterium AH-259-O06]|nr:ABC transporter ATP-binding protein [Acidobacteria bacterium AH-259-O06]
MPLLRLERVSFRYPSGFALREIDLEIPSQSFLALIGPNGSGKTTLLRLMTKLLEPESGHIYLDHQPLAKFARCGLARHMAVISSEQYFEFPFPVAQVVAMGRFPYLGRFQRMSNQDWKIVDEALEMTQTDHLRERPISQLSSGERQRVLMARAVAQKPSILMLDEPNAHLDIKHQISIFRLLQFLNRKQGMSVVVVLHDLTAAGAFCRTVALLRQGELVKQGKPEEVITTEVLRSTYGADVLVYPSPLGGFPQVTYRPETGDRRQESESRSQNSESRRKPET